jgi:XTP/dITP diphosphohydrolase
MKVVLASGNAGKLTELSALLAPRKLELVAQGALGIRPADETGCTFIENALDKARHASRESGLPALADDSGISVAALGGAPGVYSARYAGPDADDAANNAKLLTELRALGTLSSDGAPSERSRAHYYCVIVLLRHPEDPAPLIATGRWEGQITGRPSGRNGFGYDPYFWLPSLGQTAADLSPGEKNRISHRGQAVASLTRQLDASAL